MSSKSYMTVLAIASSLIAQSHLAAQSQIQTDASEAIATFANSIGYENGTEIVRKENSEPRRSGTDTELKSTEIRSLRPRVGLVLGGGAVRGAAHIGVLRVLEREGIHLDVISGTSMGAIVGGLYSAGVSPEKIEEELVKRNLFGAIISAPPVVQLSAQPFISIGRAAARQHQYPGLYDSYRLAARVDELVDSKKRKIEELPTRFAAIAVDLISGEQKIIDNGDLGMALQASSAIPMICRPILHEGSLLVDGGTLNNLPVAEAKQMGADFVIAVDVVEAPKQIEESQLKNCWNLGNRIVGLNLWRMEESQRRVADLLISPIMDKIQYSSRDPADIRAAIKAGEAAAMNALPDIKRKLCQFSKTQLSDNEPILPLR